MKVSKSTRAKIVYALSKGEMSPDALYKIAEFNTICEWADTIDQLASENVLERRIRIHGIDTVYHSVLELPDDILSFTTTYALC